MQDHPYEYRLFKFYVDVEALCRFLKKPISDMEYRLHRQRSYI